MSTSRLSVVRYGYKSVHVLNEIRRDDLKSSDGGSDFEFILRRLIRNVTIRRSHPKLLVNHQTYVMNTIILS